MLRSVTLPIAFAALGLGSGCASASGSAIRTGAIHLPPSSRPIAVYATEVPAGARELGVVEAHAFGEDGSVETLFPVFAQKVAQLGGDVAVIDGVRAEFRIVDRAQVETFAYPCGWRTCVTTRVYPALEEMMVVTMYGRAFDRAAAKAAVVEQRQEP